MRRLEPVYTPTLCLYLVPFFAQRQNELCAGCYMGARFWFEGDDP